MWNCRDRPTCQLSDRLGHRRARRWKSHGWDTLRRSFAQQPLQIVCSVVVAFALFGSMASCTPERSLRHLRERPLPFLPSSLMLDRKIEANAECNGAITVRATIPVSSFFTSVFLLLEINPTLLPRCGRGAVSRVLCCQGRFLCGALRQLLGGDPKRAGR